jgi:hypothetical protein
MLSCLFDVIKVLKLFSSEILGYFMQNQVDKNLEHGPCWYQEALEQSLAPMTLRLGFLNPIGKKSNGDNEPHQNLIDGLVKFIASSMNSLSKEANAKRIYARQTPIVRFVSENIIEIEPLENIKFENLFVSEINEHGFDQITPSANLQNTKYKHSITYSSQVFTEDENKDFISKKIIEQSDVIILNGKGVTDEQLNDYLQKAISVSAYPCFVICREDNSFDFIEVISAKSEHVVSYEILQSKLAIEIKEILLFDSLLNENDINGVAQGTSALDRITEYNSENVLSYQQCEADFECQGPITRINSSFQWQNIFKSFVNILAVKSKSKAESKSVVNEQKDKKPEKEISNLSHQKNSDNCHKLFAQFLRADQLAVYYANAHRSSFIIIYWLGAFALINAVIAIGFDTVGWLALTSAILEFLALISIYCVYRNDHKKSYHIKWLEYRSLAEMLRMTPQLNSLGMPLSAEGFERHRLDSEHDIIDGHSVGRTWLIIYTESLMRSINFDQVVINEDSLKSAKNYLQNTLIKGQITYHQNNAKKMRVVGHNLGSISYILFCLAFTFVSAKLMTKLLAALNLGIDYQLLSYIGHGLGVLAAVCPILGSAAFAIRNHAEFDISSQRSLAMQKQLNKQSANLQDMQQPTDYEKLLEYSINTSIVMQAETADWLDIYQVKETEPA